MFNKTNKKRGFTLIEILVVIAIIAILAAIVLVAINPAKRFQDARNSQRKANVESILNAIQQSMVDNAGQLTGSCAGISASSTVIASSGGIDLTPCLSSYLLNLPVDPQIGNWGGPGSYNTGYRVSKTAVGQITVDAPQSTSDGMSTTTSATR